MRESKQSQDGLKQSSASQSKNQQPVHREPKRVYKGQRAFDQDLFVLEEAQDLYNHAPGTQQPEFKRRPHKHMFRNYDDKRFGKSNQYSSQSLGHIHEVTWHVDENGELKGECGPPLKKKFDPRTGRTYYAEIEHRDPLSRETYKDDHRHEVVYSRSERITEQGLAAIREDNAQQVAQMGLQAQAKEGRQASQGNKTVTSDGGATLQELS